MKWILGLALAAVSTVVSAQEPVDYATAYHRSAADNRPLLVLVTAQWCPPCQTMKATTIPELTARNAFSGVNYATVDFDANPELATQLIGDRGLPQILIFRKVEEQWERRFLAGIQSAQGVESFMQQAGIVLEPATQIAATPAIPAVTTK